MSFAYSFGKPTDAWNQPSLKSPMPCANGVLCTKDNCHGVHPGEEGIKRLYFPGRMLRDLKTGEMIQQGPCVRLVGKNKEDVPGYYRRRTAKMSWPAWCAKEGVASALPQSPQSPSPSPEALIAFLLPNWTPPPYNSPIFTSTVPIEVLLQHMHLPENSQTQYMLRKYMEVVETLPAPLSPCPTPLYRDYLYTQTLSLSNRFLPNHPWQANLRAADTILATRVFQARLAENKERINAVGELIYARITTYLAEVEPAARANGLWAEGFTPGKATGIILASLGDIPLEVEQEGHRLLNDPKAFEAIVADCLIVVKEGQEKKNA
jgi:hypothetical protein